MLLDSLNIYSSSEGRTFEPLSLRPTSIIQYVLMAEVDKISCLFWFLLFLLVGLFDYLMADVVDFVLLVDLLVKWWVTFIIGFLLIFDCLFNCLIVWLFDYSGVSGGFSRRQLHRSGAGYCCGYFGDLGEAEARRCSRRWHGVRQGSLVSIIFCIFFVQFRVRVSCSTACRNSYCDSGV